MNTLQLSPSAIAKLDALASTLPDCTVTIEAKRIYTARTWDSCHALYDELSKSAPMRGCFVSPAVPIEIRMGTESQYRRYFPLNL